VITVLLIYNCTKSTRAKGILKSSFEKTLSTSWTFNIPKQIFCGFLPTDEIHQKVFQNKNINNKISNSNNTPSATVQLQLHKNFLLTCILFTCACTLNPVVIDLVFLAKSTDSCNLDKEIQKVNNW